MDMGEWNIGEERFAGLNAAFHEAGGPLGDFCVDEAPCLAVIDLHFFRYLSRHTLHNVRDVHGLRRWAVSHPPGIAWLA